MNRAARLARELDGTGLEHRAAELATLPVAQVDLIVAAVRASRRVGREHEKDLRRRRRSDARRFRWYDESELTARNVAVLEAQGERAAGNPDALAGLAEARDSIDRRIAAAVPRLREAGYLDVEIAAALGISKQLLGQRYGRRRTPDQSRSLFTPGDPETGGDR